MPWQSGDSLCGVVVAEQVPHAHLPPRGPQAGCQLRDQDRVSAMLGKGIVPAQGRVDHVPADGQDFIAVRLRLRFDIEAWCRCSCLGAFR